MKKVFLVIIIYFFFMPTNVFAERVGPIIRGVQLGMTIDEIKQKASRLGFIYKEEIYSSNQSTIFYYSKSDKKKHIATFFFSNNNLNMLLIGNWKRFFGYKKEEDKYLTTDYYIYQLTKYYNIGKLTKNKNYYVSLAYIWQIIVIDDKEGTTLLRTIEDDKHFN